MDLHLICVPSANKETTVEVQTHLQSPKFKFASLRKAASCFIQKKMGWSSSRETNVNYPRWKRVVPLPMITICVDMWARLRGTGGSFGRGGGEAAGGPAAGEAALVAGDPAGAAAAVAAGAAANK